LPFFTIPRSDLFVAATSRTSTSRLFVPPTRSKRRSCSTRSSLTWMAGGISPTSSRKRVPPSASSKRPCRWPMAPVKAPFSWPNSSLSSSVSGMAAQLIGTNCPVRSRADAWWMARAISSLPVPVSPSSSTVVVVCATLLTSSKMECICGFLLMMFSNE